MSTPIERARADEEVPLYVIDILDAQEADLTTLRARLETAEAEATRTNRILDNSVARPVFEQTCARLATAERKCEEALSLLPVEMPDCKIRFLKCEKGHGTLTADNWVQHPCLICERDSLRARLAETERLRFGADATRRQQRIDIERLEARLAEVERERDEAVQREADCRQILHTYAEQEDALAKVERERDEAREALEAMLNVSECCDEDGYIDGEGFVDVEKVRAQARAALAGGKGAGT